MFNTEYLSRFVDYWEENDMAKCVKGRLDDISVNFAKMMIYLMINVIKMRPDML